MFAKIAIIVILLAIVASLGSAMLFLLKDRGDSTRMLKALTIRITLSLALFFLLIIGYFAGLFQPHGIGK